MLIKDKRKIVLTKAFIVRCVFCAKLNGKVCSAVPSGCVLYVSLFRLVRAQVVIRSPLLNHPTDLLPFVPVLAKFNQATHYYAMSVHCNRFTYYNAADAIYIAGQYQNSSHQNIPHG